MRCSHQRIAGFEHQAKPDSAAPARQLGLVPERTAFDPIEPDLHQTLGQAESTEFTAASWGKDSPRLSSH